MPKIYLPILALCLVTKANLAMATMFEDATIAPTSPPKELRGISGGNAETAAIAGRRETETGPCIGFVDKSPDHKITLTTGFRSLNLEVRSSGDTILLVKGPGGSWCNDDGKGQNPAMGGEWLPGTYEVWVGSYESNAAHPYLLRIFK